MDSWQLPYFWQIVTVLGVTAVLYGSFQAGVSVLTSLSLHHLGFKRSHTSLLRLCASYVLGAFATSLTLIWALTYVLGLIQRPAPLVWAAISSYGVAVGIIVLLFYFRSGPGTMLWLPRGIADFLQTRAKKTGSAIESFSLGIMTSVAELPFIIAPLLIVSMLLRGQATINHTLGSLAFSVVATVPLTIILVLIGGGMKISRIQKWRETNKGFLQFTAGAGLIIVSIYLFVSYCVGPTV